MRLLKPLALIFTVTAMIGGIAYFYSPFRPIEESANIFASEIYPHYHEQLKAFVQQHPHYEKFKDTPLVALLEQPLGSPA